MNSMEILGMAWSIFKAPENDPAWAFCEPPEATPYLEGEGAYYEAQNPYSRGVAAFYQTEKVRENPYPENSDEHLSWQRGWFTAYQANLNDPTKGRIAGWR